jgi:2-hydroxychromene-2-carboxylate isomerase
MGDLIHLVDRMAYRTLAGSGARTAFFFDLACPFSYLAAERVERILGDVDWVPVRDLSSTPTPTPLRVEQAERRASELRLPISWPDPFPTDCTAAMRAAVFAAEHGVGRRFALAALRLAFCGGYDLADLDTVATAAEAAGLTVEACMQATQDPGRDAQLEIAARGLRAREIETLPAIRVDKRWFQGERAVAEASALLRARTVLERPLAPAG